MSYEIIYQSHAFMVDGEEAGDGEPRYVLAAEVGSNNCYVGNKRARSWSALAVGTHNEVLRQVVRLASSCEGGMLTVLGKHCKPEYLIGKYRRMLAHASVNNNSGGWWSPVVTMADAAIEEEAKQLGATLNEEIFCGSRRVKAYFETSNRKGYFEFVRRHHMDVYGWSLATVQGLPKS